MMWILRMPLAERFEAGFDLGDHALVDRAVARSARWAWLAVSELISESGSSFLRRTPLTSLM